MYRKIKLCWITAFNDGRYVVLRNDSNEDLDNVKSLTVQGLSSPASPSRAASPWPIRAPPPHVVLADSSRKYTVGRLRWLVPFG